MVLDLIVTKTDDGYTAETPSISGCETWAKDEDEAIEKIKELVAFYMNLDKPAKIKVDKARRQDEKTVYKLVFNKD
jgi:predicted RNase H-like HicB family nuclease